MVPSVKINFTIPSNKMVSNDIFNQQEKCLPPIETSCHKRSPKYDRMEITFVTSTEMLISLSVFSELCPDSEVKGYRSA